MVQERKLADSIPFSDLSVIQLLSVAFENAAKVCRIKTKPQGSVLRLGFVYFGNAFNDIGDFYSGCFVGLRKNCGDAVHSFFRGGFYVYTEVEQFGH